MGAGRPATGEVSTMRIDRGLLGWGVFLIVLGAIPLAVRAGYLDTDTVRRAWELWPLILIGIGLGLVLQRTKAAFVGGLVVALTFGLLGGSLLAVGVGGGLSSCGFGDGSSTAFPNRTDSFAGSADVSFDLSCGDLTVTPAAGSTWTVAGSDRDGQGPTIDAASSRLRVKTRDRSGIPFGEGGNHWNVTLPTDPTLTVDVSLNAGSATLDLAGAHVPDVNLTVNAGDIRLNLSRAAQVGRLDASANAGSLKLSLPAASLTGSVSANAGSVELCVPAGVGLRFATSNNPLSANNFDQRGLVRSGGTWTSVGYDTAQWTVDLSATANAGAITLNPEGGCD
jgi:hypothetical protein